MTDLKLMMPRYEAYKDSGVDWVGEIPAHWEIAANRTLFKERVEPGQKDLPLLSVSIHSGISDKEVSEEENIRGRVKIEDKTKYNLVKQKDIVFNMMRAWQGAIGSSTVKGMVSPAYIIAEPREGIYSPYFEHQYRCPIFIQQMDQFSKGITDFRKRLYWHEFKQLLTVLPPIKEQTEIANFLDHKTAKIDQAVAIKERQIRLLKERKQILIQDAVTKGLDPHVPMRDSGVGWIGEIPAHWEIAANRILFKERVDPGQEDLPLLSVSIHSGISDKEISEEENIRGRVKIEDKTKYNLVKQEDIVFNMMRAWQGAIGSSKVKGMVSPAYIIAMPIGGIYSPYFEHQYRCPIFIQQMDRFSKGITDFRKRLYWHEFKQLLTLLPPIKEQKAIVSHIQTQSKKIDNAIALQEQMIQKLKEYKATLINSAVTGKIKVPGAGERKAVA